MGLIKAIKGAVGGNLADQWKEFFYCDALDKDILVAKGFKQMGGRSTNTAGHDNVISNGSGIAVADGQCMIIVEQGKVVEICSEPGQFTYDNTIAPSVFTGNLKDSVKDTFKNIGKRFTFGGDVGADQRVYYINTKEILGNKYGTPNAVPYRVVDKNANMDIDISIKCFGEYSYKIVDPLLFYTNVCGNISDIYNRSEIDSQLKTELLTALQRAFARISDMGIRYSSLPGHTTEIAEALNEELSNKWREFRGIEVFSFGVSSVKASEEDEARIKDMQTAAAFRDPTMGVAYSVHAQAEAMKSAAKNQGGMGAMGAFMGMGMAQNAGGGVAAMYGAIPAQSAPTAQAAAGAEGWKCSCGHAGNTGKFCAECGASKPAPAEAWKCECETENTSKFCSNCGKPRPLAAGGIKCDKCGWEPKDYTSVPKFCPECGDPIDEADKK